MYVHIRCVLFRMCAYNECICFGIFKYVCTIVYVYTFIYVCIIICIYIYFYYVNVHQNHLLRSIIKPSSYKL